MTFYSESATDRWSLGIHYYGGKIMRSISLHILCFELGVEWRRG